MAGPNKSHATSLPPATGTPNAARPFRILLVDRETQVRELLSQAVESQRIMLSHAVTLEDARRKLDEQAVDLVLVDPTMPDGSGMAFAADVRRRQPLTQTIVVTGEPSLERAIEAIRLGAADFIAKPMDMEELNLCVRQAMDRAREDRRRARRNQRLRKICKKLNTAHQEVTRQVDVLCNDLVTAYQELAQQMQQVVQTSEFSNIIGEELDLEKLLRKTLEYLLQKAGPTNAAIFLPSTGDEFTLGGYVNYDCTKTSADLILAHLADVVAPKMTNRPQPVHITDNTTLAQWIGDDAAYLADSHVLAFACRHDDETLAVITLFRDQAQPYTQEVLEVCTALAPLLGDYLARVIRVHHRHIPGFAGTSEDPAFGF